MKEDIRRYLAEIGRRGGKRSRRALDSETARRMVRLREARRAFRRFRTRCFWSSPPDYLVVDVTRPYAEQGSFLEIELAARRGEAHQTCGGRAPNDDVMDTLFTQLINAGTGPVIRDGVDRSTRPASHSFPYLAAPNPDPPEPPEHH